MKSYHKMLAFTALFLLLIFLFSGCEFVLKSQLKSNGYQFTNEDFINSIKMGNKKAVSLFVELGIDVNQITENHKTPLYYATSVQSPCIMKILIENGANVNSTDSPIEIACERNNTDLIEILLQNGADISNNIKPLLIAVQNRSIDVAKLLLSDGAMANVEGTEAVLELATEKSNIEMIELLIEYECNISINALTKAIINEDLEVLELLLKSGVNPNIENTKSPLLTAIETNNIEAFKLLVHYGANISKIENSGFYHKELFRLDYKFNEQGYINSLNDGNYEAIELFLKEGFDPNLPINEFDSPLLVIINHNSLELVKLLVKYKADINTSDYYGFTALAHAVSKGSLNIVQYLINQKVDISASCSVSLANAVRNNNYEIAKVLLENGANPNDEGILAPPLFLACANDNMDLVKLLLEYKADINLNIEPQYLDFGYIEGVSFEGTATEIATSLNSVEIVNYLLLNGADPNIASEKLAICTASQLGNLELVKLLHKNGASLTLIQKHDSFDDIETTALILAAENNHKDIVEYILSNAEFSANYLPYMNIALKKAQEKKHVDIATLINSYINTFKS